MQIAKPNFVHNTNETFSSVVRNTSWSRGWLRTFMQALFCAITVASFILIVYMAFESSQYSSSTSKCQSLGCTVFCEDAPYHDLFEDDIVYAVSEIGYVCSRVMLSLKHPTFLNNTLPERWLSRLPATIYELEIIGGNLQYIAPQAFMSRFTRKIRRLTFEFITLMEWNREMLVGLMDLQELVFRSCNFVTIKSNALEPVDDTLQTISITTSGFWDPTNLTGSSYFQRLTDVILSSNNFNNILRRTSFAQLTGCTVLYLNSCRIHAIRPGTFDSLVNIQVLHLNNNFLQVLPSGLFDHIIPVLNPRPKINLQDNRWLCDCSNNELRQLTTAGLLLVDPACFYPEADRGQTFTEFLNDCDESTRDNHNQSIVLIDDIASSCTLNVHSVFMDSNCQSNTSQNGISTWVFISPIELLPCSFNRRRSPEILMRIHRKPQEKRPKSNGTLQTSFTLRDENYSILEVSSTGSEGLGLIWYQDKCSNEIYCISSIPSSLRVYNLDENAEYTFCPWVLDSGAVDYNNCIFYRLDSNKVVTKVRVIMYMATVLFCFSCGALLIYLVIRKFPNLLKGSNRILFVKHKNVEALILPPKVPVRSSLIDSEPITEFNDKHIFLVSDRGRSLRPPFFRTRSVRSHKSIAPSYVSALQPTAEQLTEWRLRHHFSNDMTIMSNLDSSILVYEDDDISYCSLDKVYESLK